MDSIPQPLPGFKKCSKCGTVKPNTPEYFRPKHNQCRECRNKYSREYQRKWRKEHPEEKRLSVKRWRENNPERNKEIKRKERIKNKARYAERAREYRKNNKEKIRKYQKRYENTKRAKEKAKERGRRWRENNKEKARAQRKKWIANNKERHRKNKLIQEHRRRARKLSADGSHTKDDIKTMRIQQNNKCWYCGVDLSQTGVHVDHRIPISRGGSDSPSNLVLSCPACNMSKHNKMPHEWNGRLL